MAHRSSVGKVSRRNVLKKATAGAAAAAVSVSIAGSRTARGVEERGKGTFVLCINTSTIRGQDAAVPLPKEIELAAKAGYSAMEPWIREIEAYVKAGGDLKDLRKRFEDNGIAVVDAIGFAPWLMGDETAHKKGLEAMKRDMDLVAQIGAKHI